MKFLIFYLTLICTTVSFAAGECRKAISDLVGISRVESLSTSYEAIKGLNKGKKAQMMRRIFDDLQSGQYENITGIFDDYFSQVRKNWAAVEKVAAKIDLKRNSPKEIWNEVAKIETDTVKRVIMFKELTQESFPRTIALLRENGLEKELNSFLKIVETESLSKYSL